MHQDILSNNTQLALLYTTIPSLKEAEYLATKALEAKHAVCVNIIPGMQAIYLLDDKVERAVECSIFFKTTIHCLPELERWILENHPYKTPAIFKWEASSSEPYYEYAMSQIQNRDKMV